MLCIIFIACLTASFILMFESKFHSTKLLFLDVILLYICFSVDQTVDGSFVGLAISQSLILTGMLQHGMRQIADVVSQMTCVERVVEYTTLPKEVIQTAAGTNVCITILIFIFNTRDCLITRFTITFVIDYCQYSINL